MVELSNEDQIVELLTPFEKSSTSLLVDLAVNMAEWLSISDGKISSFKILSPGAIPTKLCFSSFSSFRC